MNSFISWIGGKKLLRKRILDEFPDRTAFDRYIEVFGGAGWVLFAKDSRTKLEVYNDVNSNLVNLYRCVKYHPRELQRELDGMMMSRELFFDAVSQMNMHGLTDIQRAARFFVIIKESFGAGCRSFCAWPKDIGKAVDFLSVASERLRMVVIENLDFENLMRTYDSDRTLFYLDPPYYDAEKYYPDRFQPNDHERLRNCLRNIKGKFVLSYNDCQEIRDLYTGYKIIEVSRNDNLVTKNGDRKYQELIIKNFA